MFKLLPKLLELLLSQLCKFCRHNHMAALRSICGHYIFALWFLSFYLSIFFIPRLISAVADWMPTILRLMMWPWCEFRMHV